MSTWLDHRWPMLCHIAWLAIAYSLVSCAFSPRYAGAMPSVRPLEIVPGSFHFDPSTLQAGAHGDLHIAFDFAHTPQGRTYDDAKEVVVEVPPGFVGSDTAVPTCTFAQLLSNGATTANRCPPASQVGTISFEATILRASPEKIVAPIYSMEPTSFGVTAEIGLKTLGVTAVLLVTPRTDDLGLTSTAPNIERLGEFHNVSTTIWAVPASPVHDKERGMECTTYPVNGGEQVCLNGGESANIPIKPFLANPTSCDEFTARISATSWEEPERSPPTSSEATGGPIKECERVPFDPAIKAQPTTDSVESPSGLEFSAIIPQRWDEPLSISSADLNSATVALPIGYTVNPSAGAGLLGCTAEQLRRETASSPPGAGCPQASTLGSVEIETPLLAEKIMGSVYLAEPLENPFGALLALYVVAKAPSRGIIVKLAGQVEVDETTGQLVSQFHQTPQQPFNRFTLKFRQGATSPLVSPPVCGRYTVLADFTPWSAPDEPRALSDSFEITKGLHGGACPSGGVAPFAPAVIAGETSNAAGSYSPFYLRIIREDGEQEIAKFTTALPPGLTGNLSGIPFCPDSAIEAARSASGQHELSSPSCPAASEIGHTLVGAGVGNVLAWTPGKVYLAGPYHGAPLSFVSVTSATVGPFDLGTVVIRFALRINTLTAQVEVDSSSSDAIPHMLPPGIVVHVRDIHVYVDRPNFIINPTSCDPMSIADTIAGADVSVVGHATAATTTTVLTRFQATDCQNLRFKPDLKVTTSGRTSRSRGASLKVRLSYPPGSPGTQANIRSVKVNLPRQLPSRLATLQKACPDSVFNANPATCPAASRVGQATAITPILPVPLMGPAYFVSHGGVKFPELVIVLQGYGLTIDLHGETFISRRGVTSSTFRTIPDEPVTSFELVLPQGVDSALAANGSLCNVKLHMPTALVAQNGMAIHRSVPISATGCRAHRSRRGSSHGGRNKTTNKGRRS